MSQKRFTNAKIVVLGGAGVGKTAFTVRYITKRYIGDYAPNTEMMYTHRLVGTRDEATLEILDTAYQSPPETMEKHIRWAEGFILMYSVTDRHSYQDAYKLKDTIFQTRGADVPVVLVANKHDLLTARAVTEDECDNLAGEMDCPRFQISVAEGQDGVSETMEELLVLIKRQLVKSLSNTEHVAGLEKRSRFVNMKKAFKKKIVRSRSDTF
uniref:small monomeric GTPase n=1 Tax=Arion vulgaris TaxID=1028688 RepID=A0A0B6ZM95_9EUPU